MWIEDKRTAWEAPACHLNGKLFYILYTIIMFFPRCSCRSVQSTVVFGRRRPKLLGSTLATLKGHRARNIPQCWWRLCCRLCFDVSWWFCFFAPLFCLCGEFCSCYFLFMKFMKNLLLLQLSGGGMSCWRLEWNWKWKPCPAASRHMRGTNCWIALDSPW